jgi:quercetin dioxygenase-like cupin family protein
MPAATTIVRHQVPGEITVQCLEGRVSFDAGGVNRELRGGEMLYLDGSTSHALHAVENSSVLVTILLQRKNSAGGS